MCLGEPGTAFDHWSTQVSGHIEHRPQQARLSTSRGECWFHCWWIFVGKFPLYFPLLSILRFSTGGAGQRRLTCMMVVKRWWWSIVMSVSVCVCLSAMISSELHVRSSPNVLCSLPMAVARSSSGSVVVICHVPPVVWMTSYLLISQACSTSPPS